METLIIYDNNGKIFTQITGDFEIPVGLQHIITEIPEGKVLVSVNPSTHEPVLINRPQTDIERLEEMLEEHAAGMMEIVEMIVGGE